MLQPIEQIQPRRASVADISGLIGLLSLLFVQEADFNPDEERQRCGLLLILGQAEIGQIYCVEARGKIVGMVSILFSVSTAEGGRVAWLEDMIVHPEMRGYGIGERLLHHAIGGARDAGCRRITLLTDETNNAAMSFYTRSGFIRSQMVPFRLKL